MPDTELVPPTAVKPTLTLDGVQEALKRVIDPELGVNIVDLGLIYRLQYGQNNALLITMTLTSAACLLAQMIEEEVGKALNGIVGEWRLNWVWMPPWGPDRITDDGRNQMRTLGSATSGPQHWTSRTAP